MVNIRKLEAELWDAADLLRAGSNAATTTLLTPTTASPPTTPWALSSADM